MIDRRTSSIICGERGDWNPFISSVNRDKLHCLVTPYSKKCSMAGRKNDSSSSTIYFNKCAGARSLSPPPASSSSNKMKRNDQHSSHKLCGKDGGELVVFQLDPQNKILATELISKYIQPPWLVVKSKVYEGNFFFYNLETKECEWSLDEKRLGLKLHSSVPVSSSSGVSNHKRKVEGVEEELRDPVFSVIEGLGVGGYATVLKVVCRQSGNTYAMKVVVKDMSLIKENQTDKKALSKLRMELHCMRALDASPFIQRCHLAFESPMCVFFILDFNAGGDFYYHLCQRFSQSLCFSEEEVRVVLSELYLALEHLHKHRILHRDVKIENIMMDASGHVKLIDFGHAIELPQDSECISLEPGGSLAYAAPESLRSHFTGRFTDWWAYGVLAYELFSGKSPWSSLMNSNIIKRDILEMPIKVKGLRTHATNFILSLMCRNVDQRLGTKADTDIRKCLFFESIDWEKTASLQAPPAFKPGKVALPLEERQQALDTYHQATQLAPDKNSQCWYLGLDDSSLYL